MDGEADGTRSRGREKLHYGDEAGDYVTEVLENCVWRQAITVDGITYWTTKDGRPGETVANRSYKYRHKGSYMLLAPMDADPKEHGMTESEEIKK
jgi:hypothetical protein